MTQLVKRVLWQIVGWAFVVAGVIGMFVPFFQGILSLLIGLIILSSEYVWAHKLLMKIRARFPMIAEIADRAKAKTTHWFHRATRTEEA